MVNINWILTTKFHNILIRFYFKNYVKLFQNEEKFSLYQAISILYQIIKAS